MVGILTSDVKKKTNLYYASLHSLIVSLIDVWTHCKNLKCPTILSEVYITM